MKARPRLFRTISSGHGKTFLLQPVGENSFTPMVKRVNLLLPVELRAKDFNGNETSVSQHSGRASGTTSALKNGVSTAEVALLTKHHDLNSVSAYNRSSMDKMAIPQSLIGGKKNQSKPKDFLVDLSGEIDVSEDGECTEEVVREPSVGVKHKAEASQVVVNNYHYHITKRA